MNEKYTIYGLINPIDDTCFYIGQTKRGLQTRLGQHIRSKKENHHKNLIIERIIAVGLKPKIEEIITIEDYYIEELKIHYWQFAEMYCEQYFRIILRQPLTNIALCGYTCWDNKRNKKIKQYNLNGIYIKTFSSCSTAARSFKDRSFESVDDNIRECLLGRRKVAYGFQWCYVGDENKILSDAKIRNVPQHYKHTDKVQSQLNAKRLIKEKKREEHKRKLEEWKSPETLEKRRLKRNECSRNFNKTDAGKKSKRKYYQTPEGKKKKLEERRRYRLNPENVLKEREQKRKYREQNREKIREKDKEYYRKKKENSSDEGTRTLEVKDHAL